MFGLCGRFLISITNIMKKFSHRTKINNQIKCFGNFALSYLSPQLNVKAQHYVTSDHDQLKLLIVSNNG